MLTSFANDTFTDSSGVSLGSHTPDSGGSWTKLGESSNGSVAVISNANRVRNQNAAGWNGYYHSADPASADYDVAYTGRPVSTSGEVGALARVDTSTEDFYYASTVVSTGVHLVGKYVSGTFTTLASGTSTIQTGQDHFERLIVRGDFLAVVGKGGVVAYAQDTAITAAGKAGVYLNGNAIDTSGSHIDTWEAFDVGTLDIRSFSTGNGSSATMTAAKPPNTQTGDTASITWRMSSQTVTVDTVPDGWTLRQETPMSTASAGWIRTYDHVIEAGDPDTWDWVLSASTSWRYYCQCFVGEAVYDTTAESSTAFPTNGSTSTPTATAAEDESLIVFAFGIGAAASTSSSAMLDYPDFMATVQTPPGFPYMAAGWGRQAVAGTTTAATWSRPGTGTSGAQHIVVYYPAATATDIAGTDDATTAITDSGTVAAASAGTDTATVSTTETGSVAAEANGTDGGTVSLTDAATVTAQIASTDAVAVGISDAGTVAAGVAGTDTATAATSETATLAAQVVGADTATSVLTDAGTVAAAIAGTESAIAATSESGSVEASSGTTYVSGTDAVGIQLIESGTLGATADGTDAVAVALSEAASIAVSVQSSDTIALGLDDSGTVVVSLTVSDFLAMALSELATVEDLAALPTILGRMYIGEAFTGRLVIDDALAGSLSIE